MAPRKTTVAALLVVTLSLFFVQSAAAQVARPRADFSPAAIRAAASASVLVRGARVEARAADLERQRPSILMTSLYATTALVQGLDAHSTLKAINVGATERNPMMSFLTSHPPVFVALKTGAAAGLIVAGRKLARHSKVKAAIALIAIDATYAAIVAHNYKVAARLR